MKCHAFVACNKIIIDKDGAHSIIEIMLNAEIRAVRTAVVGNNNSTTIEIPPNAVSPQVWWLYTQWEPSSQDVGEDFEQVFQVYWPNGDKFAETRLQFNQKDDKMNQTSFFFGGFPLGQEGKLRLLTWLDHHGHSSEVIESFVMIKHVRIPASQQQGVYTS